MLCPFFQSNIKWFLAFLLQKQSLYKRLYRMNPWMLIYFILFLHLISAVSISNKIKHSNLFEKKIEWFHIIMTWLIPFLWGKIVGVWIRDQCSDVPSWPYRTQSNRVKHTDNWEFLTGFGAGYAG